MCQNVLGKDSERACSGKGFGPYNEHWTGDCFSIMRKISYQVIVLLWETLNFTVIDWRTDITSTAELSNFSELKLKNLLFQGAMELLRDYSILS